MLACCVVILVATFGHGWFSVDERGAEGGIGLTGAEVCFMSRCAEVDWGDMGDDVPGDLVLWGYLEMLAGLAAAGACAIAGGLALTRNTGKIPVKYLQYALIAAAAGAGVFFARVMMLDKPKPDISYGGFLMIVGLGVASYVLKQMLAPLVKAAPQLPAGPAPQLPPQQLPPAGQPMAATPMAAPSACPRCGGPIEYVAQYQRYFCRRCNQYV